MTRWDTACKHFHIGIILACHSFAYGTFNLFFPFWISPVLLFLVSKVCNPAVDFGLPSTVSFSKYFPTFETKGFALFPSYTSISCMYKCFQNFNIQYDYIFFPLHFTFHFKNL